MAVYLNAYKVYFETNNYTRLLHEENKTHQQHFKLANTNQIDIEDAELLFSVISYSKGYPELMFSLEFCAMDAEEDCLYYIINGEHYWVRKAYPEFDLKAKRVAL